MINEVIDSPFSNGKATLSRKSNKVDFRKETFEFVEHFYVCDETKEEFTTQELDRLNLNQVYNQYRNKYGLPFPDQIKSIRQKYGLSASKMSEILGLGANTYRLYEQGEIPSVGNGRLITAAEDPGEFKKFLTLSREIIGENDFQKILKNVLAVEEDERRNRLKGFPLRLIFSDLTPNDLTGYRIPTLEKVSHMIMFFSSMSNTWTTKLNKLLFYCDFSAFKTMGMGISGLRYKALPYGPVPFNYENLYSQISGELLERKYEESFGYEGSFFEPKLTFNELLFDKIELEIMQDVAAKFKFHNASEMAEISHREAAWQDNIEKKGLISYRDYAFRLKAI